MTRYQGLKLYKNPTSALVKGTSLGTARIQFEPGRVNTVYRREADNAINTILYAGAQPRLLATFTDITDTFLQEAFPNFNTRNSQTIVVSTGQVKNPGTLYTGFKLLAAAFDDDDNDFSWIFYDVVPLIEETEQINISFINALEIAVIFEVRPDNDKTHEFGPLSELNFISS